MKLRFIEYWISHPFWGAIDYLTFSFFRLFPLNQVSEFGAFVGKLAKKRFKQANLDTSANLQLLIPDITNEQKLLTSDVMWQNIARTLSEMAVLDKLNIEKNLQENDLNVLKGLDKNKPVVFLFPHLGNWEILAMSVSNQGFKLNVMFEQIPIRFQRKLLITARKRIGYDLITPDYHGTRKLFKVLAAGESVGLAMDEFSNNKIVAPVFNGTISDRSNIHYAITLARRFDAPIVLGLCKRLHKTSFQVNYDNPIYLSSPEYLGQSDEYFAEMINIRLKKWILENIDQWYMLHRARING
jgi:Kdo2-lipid IVA lauroyltransferase/acyltransferase